MTERVEGNTEIRSHLVNSIQAAASEYTANSTSEAAAAQAVETTNTFDRPSFEAPKKTESSKAKSIAEKLGFMNFDDDEFDTPSYMRKDSHSI